MQEPDTSLQWYHGCDIAWRGGTVARLQRGQTLFTPRIRILRSDWLDGHQRSRLQKRLQQWVNVQVRLWQHLFVPGPHATPSERAILYGLEKGYGWVSRETVSGALKDLSKGGRKRLKRQGVHFGAQRLFMPVALGESGVKVALWMAQDRSRSAQKWTDEQVLCRKEWPRDLLELLGFVPVGPFGVRSVGTAEVADPRGTDTKVPAQAGDRQSSERLNRLPHE